MNGLMVEYSLHREHPHIQRHLDNGLRRKAMDYEFPLRNSGLLTIDLKNRTVSFPNEPKIEFVSLEYLSDGRVCVGTEYSEFFYRIV